VRKSNEQSLQEVIDDLLDAYKLRGKFNQKKIIASWERIMGKTIANRTDAIFFRENKLIVKLNSSVLREELSFSKNKIIQLLNEDIGEEVVKEVVLI
jgi:hypothetical protein